MKLVKVSAVLYFEQIFLDIGVDDAWSHYIDESRFRQTTGYH